MYDKLSARYHLDCFFKPCGNSRRMAWKAFISTCRGIRRGKGRATDYSAEWAKLFA